MAQTTGLRLPTWATQRGTLLVLFGGAVLFIAFENGISYMLDGWRREEYSHGWLIPAIAAMMVLTRVPQLPPADRTWGGLGLVGVGLLLLAAGELSTIVMLSQYALLAVVAGLVWTVFGARATWALAGPLLYLVFMIPLPEFLYSGVSAKMQLLSSQLGVWFLRHAGVSVFLEGNVIDLGTYKLEVAEACSGLRYLFPLLSFTYIAAVLLDDRAWKRVVLFLSAVPITLVMNSIRIAIIGLLVSRHGIGMAEGALHFFEGWLFFMICTAVIAAEGLMLVRIGRGGAFRPFADLIPRREHFAALAQISVPNSFFAAAGLVAAVGLAMSSAADRVEDTPPRKPLVAFPLSVDGWSGRPSALQAQVLEALKLTDYLLADFTRPGQRGFVNFYVAYYDSQRTGAAAHSPQACIPGGGWEITRHTVERIDRGGGLSLTVNRLVIRRGEARQLVYYWFDQRGRNITNEYQVKGFLFWDALTRNRTDGALIRLTTPLLPGEDEVASERRVADFVRAVYGRLGEYVPK